MTIRLLLTPVAFVLIIAMVGCRKTSVNEGLIWSPTDKDTTAPKTRIDSIRRGGLFGQGLPKTTTKDDIETASVPNVEMIHVEGDTFEMGCTNEQGSECKSEEKPQHTISLKSYYIGVTEVTQAQWQAVMKYNPSKFTGCDECPVESVTWYETQTFIKELNDRTHLGYRLPTEAEWEYAARGGAKTKGYKYAGSNSIGTVAWNWTNSDKKPHAVGKKDPNELGLYDMSGNVWEWCQDWYGKDYYKSSPSENPKGPKKGVRRVLRGGSWFVEKEDCRISHRYDGWPDVHNGNVGFRLARD